MGYAYAYAGNGERGPWGRGPIWGGHFPRPVGLALMILGFVFFWPIGLAMLFFFVWRKKMGCHGNARIWPRHWRHDGSFREQAYAMFQGGSGNAAFDEYRDEVLKRLDEERRKLDEEQMAFRAFVDRLRRAKDQEEFDRFMSERNGSADRRTDEPPAQP